MVRKEIEEYFLCSTNGLPEPQRSLATAWRVSCYDSGLRYVSYLESNWASLSGKTVLDVACAWGGHGVALAERGGNVIAADINNHRFRYLVDFSNKQQIELRAAIMSCQELAIADSSVDVVLALEVIEHIPDPNKLAEEVSRVLKPGGICLVSTPSRFRSFFFGEPHYEMKGITILPLFLQKVIAQNIFGKSYPYPIPRQYARATSVMRPFVKNGLTGEAILSGRLGTLLSGCNPKTKQIVAELLWNFIVFRK